MGALADLLPKDARGRFLLSDGRYLAPADLNDKATQLLDLEYPPGLTPEQRRQVAQVVAEKLPRMTRATTLLRRPEPAEPTPDVLKARFRAEYEKFPYPAKLGLQAARGLRSASPTLNPQKRAAMEAEVTDIPPESWGEWLARSVGGLVPFMAEAGALTAAGAPVGWVYGLPSVVGPGSPAERAVSGLVWSKAGPIAGKAVQGIGGAIVRRAGAKVLPQAEEAATAAFRAVRAEGMEEAGARTFAQRAGAKIVSRATSKALPGALAAKMVSGAAAFTGVGLLEQAAQQVTGEPFHFPKPEEFGKTFGLFLGTELVTGGHGLLRSGGEAIKVAQEPAPALKEPGPPLPEHPLIQGMVRSIGGGIQKRWAGWTNPRWEGGTNPYDAYLDRVRAMLGERPEIEAAIRSGDAATSKFAQDQLRQIASRAAGEVNGLMALFQNMEPPQFPPGMPIKIREDYQAQSAKMSGDLAQLVDQLQLQLGSGIPLKKGTLKIDNGAIVQAKVFPWDPNQVRLTILDQVHQKVVPVQFETLKDFRDALNEGSRERLAKQQGAGYIPVAARGPGEQPAGLLSSPPGEAPVAAPIAPPRPPPLEPRGEAGQAFSLTRSIEAHRKRSVYDEPDMPPDVKTQGVESLDSAPLSRVLTVANARDVAFGDPEARALADKARAELDKRAKKNPTLALRGYPNPNTYVVPIPGYERLFVGQASEVAVNDPNVYSHMPRQELAQAKVLGPLGEIMERYAAAFTRAGALRHAADLSIKAIDYPQQHQWLWYRFGGFSPASRSYGFNTGELIGAHTIWMNPWVSVARTLINAKVLGVTPDEVPRLVASQMAATLQHEVVHNVAPGHVGVTMGPQAEARAAESFGGFFTRLVQDTQPEMLQLKNELTAALTANDHQGLIELADQMDKLAPGEAKNVPALEGNNYGDVARRVVGQPIGVVGEPGRSAGPGIGGSVPPVGTREWSRYVRTLERRQTRATRAARASARFATELADAIGTRPEGLGLLKEVRAHLVDPLHVSEPNGKDLAGPEADASVFGSGSIGRAFGSAVMRGIPIALAKLKREQGAGAGGITIKDTGTGEIVHREPAADEYATDPWTDFWSVRQLARWLHMGGGHVILPPNVRDVTYQGRATQAHLYGAVMRQLHVVLGDEGLALLRPFSKGDRALFDLLDAEPKGLVLGKTTVKFTGPSGEQHEIPRWFYDKVPQIRGLLDQMHAMAVAQAKARGVTPPRYIKDYISHIILGLDPQRFRQHMDFLSGRTLTDAQIKDLRNRFYEQREGEPNYRRSFFLAMEAYTSAFSRKYAFDPVLDAIVAHGKSEASRVSPDAIARWEATKSWTQARLFSRQSYQHQQLNSGMRMALFSQHGSGVMEIFKESAAEYTGKDPDTFAMTDPKTGDKRVFDRFAYVQPGRKARFTSGEPWVLLGTTSAGGKVYGFDRGVALGADGPRLRGWAVPAFETAAFFERLGANRNKTTVDQAEKVLTRQDKLIRLERDPANVLLGWWTNRTLKALVGYNLRSTFVNAQQVLMHTFPEVGVMPFVKGTGKWSAALWHKAMRVRIDALEKAGYLNSQEAQARRQALPLLLEELLAQGVASKPGEVQLLHDELKRVQAGWDTLSARVIEAMSPLGGYGIAESMNRGWDAAILWAQGRRMGFSNDQIADLYQNIAATKDAALTSIAGKITDRKSAAHYLAVTPAITQFHYDLMGQPTYMAGPIGRTFFQLTNFATNYLLHQELRPLEGAIRFAGALGKRATMGRGERLIPALTEGYKAPKNVLDRWAAEGGLGYQQRHAAAVFVRKMAVSGALLALSEATHLNFMIFGTPLTFLGLLASLKALFPNDEAFKRWYKYGEMGAVTGFSRGWGFIGPTLSLFYDMDPREMEWRDFVLNLTRRTFVTGDMEIRRVIRENPEWVRANAPWMFDVFSVKSGLYGMTPGEVRAHQFGVLPPERERKARVSTNPRKQKMSHYHAPSP